MTNAGEDRQLSMQKLLVRITGGPDQHYVKDIASSTTGNDTQSQLKKKKILKIY